MKREQKRLRDFPVKVELGKTLELEGLLTHIDPNARPVQGFFQGGKGLPGFQVAFGQQPFPVGFGQAGGLLEDVVGVEGLQDGGVEVALELESIADGLVDVADRLRSDLVAEDGVEVLQGGGGSGRIGVRRRCFLAMAEGCQAEQQQSQQELTVAALHGRSSEALFDPPRLPL